MCIALIFASLIGGEVWATETQYEVIMPKTSEEVYRVIDMNNLLRLSDNQVVSFKNAGTYSGIAKHFYGNYRPSTVRELIKANGLDPSYNLGDRAYWLYEGRKVIVPMPQVKEQLSQNENVTTMSIGDAVLTSVVYLPEVLRQGGLNSEAALVEGFDARSVSDSLTDDLLRTSVEQDLEHQLTCTGTFGEQVQAWTQIKVKVEGKVAYKHFSEDIAIRAVYSPFCRNVYLQLVRVVKDTRPTSMRQGKPKARKMLFPLPPPPPPPFIQETKVVSPTVAAVTPEDDWCPDCHPDFESSVFAGHFIGVGDNQSLTYYRGHDTSIFPCPTGNWRVGLSRQDVNWEGKTGPGKFEGTKAYTGLVAQYLQPSSKTNLVVRYGEKKGEFAEGDYRNWESAEILNIEGYHQWWNDRDWFNFSEIGFRVEQDLDGDKESYWKRYQIPEEKDRRQSQSEYHARYKVEIKEFTPKHLGPITPFMEAEISRFESNGEHALEPRLGAKLAGRTIEVKAGYEWREGSSNDSIHLTGSVDLREAARKLGRWFKSKRSAK